MPTIQLFFLLLLKVPVTNVYEVFQSRNVLIICTCTSLIFDHQNPRSSTLATNSRQVRDVTHAQISYSIIIIISYEENFFEKLKVFEIIA